MGNQQEDNTESVDLSEFLENSNKYRKEITAKLYSITTKEERLTYLETLDLSEKSVQQALSQVLVKSIKEEFYEVADAISTCCKNAGLEINYEEINDIKNQTPFVKNEPKLQISEDITQKDIEKLLDYATKLLYNSLCFLSNNQERVKVLENMNISISSLKIMLGAIRMAEENNEKEVGELIEYFIRAHQDEMDRVIRENDEKNNRNDDE